MNLGSRLLDEVGLSGRDFESASVFSVVCSSAVVVEVLESEGVVVESSAPVAVDAAVVEDVEEEVVVVVDDALSSVEVEADSLD